MVWNYQGETLQDWQIDAFEYSTSQLLVSCHESYVVIRLEEYASSSVRYEIFDVNAKEVLHFVNQKDILLEVQPDLTEDNVRVISLSRFLLIIPVWLLTDLQ